MTPIKVYLGCPGAGPTTDTRGDRNRPSPPRRLDGWQVAGILLLWVYFSPALATGTGDALAMGLDSSLLSAPLLAWLLTPLKRSDDIYDETSRRGTERIDALAVVLIWTWPLTCGVPIAAIGRWFELFLTVPSS